MEVKNIATMKKLTKELSSLKLKKLADITYNKLVNTPIDIIKDPQVYNYYNSVVINVNISQRFLIPGFFYKHAITNKKVDFTESITKGNTWLDIIANIINYSLKFIAPLNPSDIVILKAITFYKQNGLFNNIDFNFRRNIFLQINPLAKIVNLSKRWTYDRFNYLINAKVIFFNYIPNPFLFGLRTFLLVYDSNNNFNESNLDVITLNYLKLSYSKIIRIIQLPNTISPDDLISLNGTIKEITDIHYSNNLSNLFDNHTQPFRDIPDFDTTRTNYEPIIESKESLVTWIKNIDFENKQISYPYLKKLSFQNRISIIIQILNYFSKWCMNSDNARTVADFLGIKPIEFIEGCKFILDNDLLDFYPKLNRIGLNNRYGVYIVDETHNNSALILKLYNILVQLPQSSIYIGNNFIFAYIEIPDNFINPFFNYISQYYDKLVIYYGMFTTLKSWNRYSIFIPEGTNIDAYGIHFPRNFIDKLVNR